MKIFCAFVTMGFVSCVVTIRGQQAKPDIITTVLLNCECDDGTGNLLLTHVGVSVVAADIRRECRQSYTCTEHIHDHSRRRRRGIRIFTHLT